MNRWRKVKISGSLHLSRTEKQNKQFVINGKVNDYKASKGREYIHLGGSKMWDSPWRTHRT